MVQVNDLMARQPRAWSWLLAQDPEISRPVVTSVEHETLADRRSGIRYLLKLDGHPEPIALVGKQTNEAEARFYHDISPNLGSLAPHCWFSHIEGDKSWIVLDEAYDDWPVGKRTNKDVEGIIQRMTYFHAAFWDREGLLTELGLSSSFSNWPGKRKSTDPLDGFAFTDRSDTQPSARDQRIGVWKSECEVLLSEHAQRTSGKLAPILTKAASGLKIICLMGGWPGVLEEQQLSAFADLLDDPLPMLYPLWQLPVTLLHGDMTAHHWRLSLFGEYRLLNWEKVRMGPAVCDLVSFIEHFELISSEEGAWNLRKRWPLSEETMVDSYILAMGRNLGSSFNARAFRDALPAARCLYVLTNWLPRIDDWFGQSPLDSETWQKLNQMSDNELTDAGFGEFVTLRPYLVGVFHRWMGVYRSL